MAEAVSRRPLSAETQLRSQVSPCGICVGYKCTGTHFLRILRFSPVRIVPPMRHTHLHLPFALTRSTKGWILGNIQNNSELPEHGKRWIEKYFHLVFKVKAYIHRALREKPIWHIMDKLDLFKPQSWDPRCRAGSDNRRYAGRIRTP
jgi:hypothetical protein